MSFNTVAFFLLQLLITLFDLKFIIELLLNVFKIDLCMIMSILGVVDECLFWQQHFPSNVNSLF